MDFAISVTSPPAKEPITLQDAKDFAKIEVSDDDRLVDSLIKSARQYAENFTRRAFITQTITMSIDWCFPCVIELPVNPVQSVTVANFTYVDTNGNVTQVPTATYTADVSSDPARIYLAFDQTWPDVRDQRKAISVEFVAGYGDNGSDVPEPIITAIKMMVNHTYENRMPHVLTVGGVLVNVPKTVDALLLPYTALI